MSELLNFIEVEGVTILVQKPSYIGGDPRIIMDHKNEKVELTVSSGDYENDFGEFMLKTVFPEKHREKAEEILNELIGEREKLSFFTKGFMKEKYLKMLADLLGK